MSRIGVVVVLLFGLVVSTPVVCVCGPADHGSLALHSLLPHSHQHLPSPAAEAPQIDPGDPADAAGRNVRAPGLRAQTGMGAVAVSVTGAIGLTSVIPWTIVPAPAGSLRLALVLAPAAPYYQPPGPPPRSAVS